MLNLIYFHVLENMSLKKRKDRERKEGKKRKEMVYLELYILFPQRYYSSGSPALSVLKNHLECMFVM